MKWLEDGLNFHEWNIPFALLEKMDTWEQPNYSVQIVFLLLVNEIQMLGITFNQDCHEILLKNFKEEFKLWHFLYFRSKCYFSLDSYLLY